MVPDVAIVGGGVIGCACARELARTGLRVVVVDRGAPGAEASGAALGMIGPRVERDRPAALLDLWRASQAMFPALIESLVNETGERVEYSRAGRISLAFDETDGQQLRAALTEQKAAAIPVDWLEGDEIRAMEPAVNPAVVGGLFFRENHVVDNRRLAPVLAKAAERAGVELRLGVPVAGLMRDGTRVVGLLVGETRVRAGAVVIAAGAWSGALDPVHPAPVRPVRGQAMAVATTPGLVRHLLSVGDTTIVHRATGRTVLGASAEEVDFEPGVAAGNVRRFLSDASRGVPALDDARFLEAWSGFRPGTPDGLPIIGADPDYRGLYWATGHLGVGIALAPVTAAVIADLVLGRAFDLDLAPFRPNRWGA